MAENTVVYTGTGRRKEAVARVRLVPGTGKIVVNSRDAAQYFGRQQLVDNAAAPLRLTETAESFDVLARCDGGGINGQSGALRLGIARALLQAGEYREELKALETRAACGDRYRASLCTRIAKLSAVAQPMLKRTILDAMLKGLSIGELEETADALGKMAQAHLPVMPQLAAAQADTGENTADDRAFCI